MPRTAKPKTTDALEIIDDLYFKGRPDMQELLARSRAKLALAHDLRTLREHAEVSQQELADRIGTTRSVIARLEKPGYEQHTVSTLLKYTGALGYTMEISFVPVNRDGKRKRSTKTSPVAKKP